MAIPKICNLGNSKHLQFGKFQTFPIWKIPKKIKLKQIPNIFNFGNSKNFQFAKFQIIPKFYNFENLEISGIAQFRKVENFQNFAIWKTQNSINFQFLKLSYILRIRII